uniref:Uncharacterized protein n=1 Tax=Mycolicibacterium neoaurum VKM Ac-1815D TaxID=700508 RepID=V5XHQ4_MYCNE
MFDTVPWTSAAHPADRAGGSRRTPVDDGAEKVFFE